MSPVSFVYIYGGNKYIEIDEDISIVLVDILDEEGCNKYRVDLLTDVRSLILNKAGMIFHNGFDLKFAMKAPERLASLNGHVISKF